jgi:hypothetical protein
MGGHFKINWLFNFEFFGLKFTSNAENIFNEILKRNFSLKYRDVRIKKVLKSRMEEIFSSLFSSSIYFQFCLSNVHLARYNVLLAIV